MGMISNPMAGSAGPLGLVWGADQRKSYLKIPEKSTIRTRAG